MTVSGLKLLKDLSFEEYLALPGFSYSFLRDEGRPIRTTDKMRLGTCVHSYLLTPADYKHENARIVRPVAAKLKQTLGVLIKYLIPELGITANFCHEGFTMPYKGRLDLCIPGRLVVDIKISTEDVRKMIEFFGYDKQLSGYALGINAKAVILISINPKTLNVTVINIPITQDWWIYQIKKKGTVYE